jgi:hypothetical protein
MRLSEREVRVGNHGTAEKNSPGMAMLGTAIPGVPTSRTGILVRTGWGAGSCRGKYLRPGRRLNCQRKYWEAPIGCD